MFFSFPKLGIKCLLSLSKGGIKYIRTGDTTWMCHGKKTYAKSIEITTWIFAKKKVERILYNKKNFAKNFYDSFILIKFGDLKPSLPLAM